MSGADFHKPDPKIKKARYYKVRIFYLHDWYSAIYQSAQPVSGILNKTARASKTDAPIQYVCGWIKAKNNRGNNYIHSNLLSCLLIRRYRNLMPRQTSRAKVKITSLNSHSACFQCGTKYIVGHQAEAISYSLFRSPHNAPWSDHSGKVFERNYTLLPFFDFRSHSRSPLMECLSSQSRLCWESAAVDILFAI